MILLSLSRYNLVMRFLQYFFILLSSIYLVSCVTLPEEMASTQPQTIRWNERVQTLLRIKHWELNGLIAIHTPDGAGSANLHWQQNQQHYAISLWGPLSTPSFKLTGEPGNVTLETANGKQFNATTPESLLASQTGWKLPVSNLFYWIRGLPVPHITAQKHFDPYHRLSELDQQGWIIQFLRYSSVKGIDIPTKIFLNYPALEVKIIISQWQF